MPPRSRPPPSPPRPIARQCTAAARRTSPILRRLAAAGVPICTSSPRLALDYNSFAPSFCFTRVSQPRPSPCWSTQGLREDERLPRRHRPRRAHEPQPPPAGGARPRVRARRPGVGRVPLGANPQERLQGRARAGTRAIARSARVCTVGRVQRRGSSSRVGVRS